MAAELVTDSLLNTIHTMASFAKITGFAAFIMGSVAAIARQSVAPAIAGLLLLSGSLFLPAVMTAALQEAERSKPKAISPQIAAEITPNQYVELVQDLHLLRANTDYANAVVSAKSDDKIDTLEYDYLKGLSQGLIAAMPESKLNELKGSVMAFETNKAKQALFHQVD